MSCRLTSDRDPSQVLQACQAPRLSARSARRRSILAVSAFGIVSRVSAGAVGITGLALLARGLLDSSPRIGTLGILELGAASLVFWYVRRPDLPERLRRVALRITWHRGGAGVWAPSDAQQTVFPLQLLAAFGAIAAVFWVIAIPFLVAIVLLTEGNLPGGTLVVVGVLHVPALLQVVKLTWRTAAGAERSG